MTLQTFPGAIREIGKQLAGLDHTIRVYREELKHLEASIAKSVLAHKAEFPNELARSSEITLRLEAASPEIRARLLKAEFDRAMALAGLGGAGGCPRTSFREVECEPYTWAMESCRQRRLFRLQRAKPSHPW
jgi:hypothetical protein